MSVKLGIEIELASVTSDATHDVLNSMNWCVCSDGSIQTRGNQRQTEFKTTTPYNINMRNIDDSIVEIATDFKNILDTLTDADANASCGIHFHFSGIHKFSVFFSKDFFDMVKNRYTDFCINATERARLANRFCIWEYSPVDTDRYRAINILGAYERHKTFEFRFFPSTTDITTLKRYVRFVLTILKDVQATEYETIKGNVSVETNNKDSTKSFNV